MRISGGGSSDFNQLQSDTGQFRNNDFVTAEGHAFAGEQSAAAVAAKYPHVQIFNPAASGIVVLVDRIVTSSGSASGLTMATYNTAFGDTPVAWASRRIGGTAGKALIDATEDAVALGTGMILVSVLANTPNFLPFTFPIILDEGKGVLMRISTVQKTLTVSYWGREV